MARFQYYQNEAAYSEDVGLIVEKGEIWDTR